VIRISGFVNSHISFWTEASPYLDQILDATQTISARFSTLCYRRSSARAVKSSKNGTGNAMVSQCANPDCRRELHYLRDGKLYQFVLSPKTGGKRLEHFWLCGERSKTMILICVANLR
jgi:hypothetical protein